MARLYCRIVLSCQLLLAECMDNFPIRLAEEPFGAESHRGKGAALVRGSNPVLDWLSVFDVETIIGRFSGILD